MDAPIASYEDGSLLDILADPKAIIADLETANNQSSAKN
jgi:hypothetical protein